jgi:hypothetical protein
LKVARTNNGPEVVPGFYLEAVSHKGGCPTVLRTDNGLENKVMASIQSYSGHMHQTNIQVIPGIILYTT